MRFAGLKTLWFHGVAYLGYKRVIVREMLFDADDDIAAATVPLDMSFLTESELEEYNGFRKPRDKAGAKQRLRKGDKCFVARHNGRIVGTFWIATGHAWSRYLSEHIQLAPDEVYGYDAFTASDYRGKKIFPGLTRAMRDYYRAEGKRRIVGYTVPENAPSMKSVPAYRPIGTIGSFRLGPIRRNFVAMRNGAAPPKRGGPERKLWDASVADLSDSEHYLDSFLAEIKRKAYLDLIERWGGVKSRRVLKTDLFEEAMGPDAFLLELKEAHLLIGMDVSDGATARACERDACRHARYLSADVRSLPFASGSIDLVVSPSTLDHFSDPVDLGRSLRELRRILSSDGRLIVTLDNRQNVFDPLLRLANRAGAVPFYLGRSYTAKELAAELTNAGFDVLETTAIVHNPRLTAVAAVRAARRIGWKPLTRAVQSTIGAMQRLQGTRLGYYSGCFVGALAVPRTVDR